MSKQRMIDTCFWDDSYILTLDPSEKLLFLYLLTNPLTTIAGVYEISMRRIAFDTGFDSDTVKRMLERFERDNRCVYRNGWIAMRNWIKHQAGAPGVQQGIERQLSEAPVELAEYVQGGSTPVEPTLNLTKLNLTKLDSDGAAPRPVVVPIPKPTKKDRDPRVKSLIDYFFAKFKETRGFEPTVNGAAWGKIFQRFLKESSEETIRIVIDSFFSYDKRTRTSIYDFDRSFDNVFGRLFDIQEGRQNAQRNKAGR